MLKKRIFNLVAPIVCLLATVSMPLHVAAANCCQPVYAAPCEEECDPCRSSGGGAGWLANAATILIAAAAGAGAGAIVANNTSGSRGRTGPTGPTGPAGTGGTGATGATGAAGLGFSVAVVPVNPTLQGAGLVAGTPITSMDFTFTALAAISLPGAIQTFVTTPIGNTTLGTTLTGLIGSTATVTIGAGPFYNGIYEAGIIFPALLASLAGLVDVALTGLNGIPFPSTTFDNSGIVVTVGLPLPATDVFFSAQIEFPPHP